MADYLSVKANRKYFEANEEFIKKLTPNVFGKAVRFAARGSTELFKKKIKRTKKFKDKTGNLRRSIQTRYISMRVPGYKSIKRGIGIVGVYGNQGSHFWLVEQGHGGPKPAKGRFFFFSTIYAHMREADELWAERFVRKSKFEMEKLLRKVKLK